MTTLNSSKHPALMAVLLAAVLTAACNREKPEAMVASAKSYIAKNDSKAASIQLKNALQANPDLAEARALLGQTLLNDRNPVGAEVELRKAMALKYSPDVVVPKLAQALLAQGKYGKVIEEFHTTRLQSPTPQADLNIVLLAAYAASGDSAGANASLKAALDANPDYVPALIYQARRKAAEGDFDGALAAIDDVIVKSPRNVDAWKFKGDLLLYAKRQATEAIAAYRKSVEIQPDFVDGHVGVVMTLLPQAKYDEAQKEIATLRKLAPNDPQTKYMDAQIAFYKKDTRLARDLSQQLLRLAPDNAMALQMAGAIEFQEGSLQQAEIYLARALQASQKLAFARRLLILTYLRLGQPGQALVTLKAAYDKGELPPEMYSVAGQVYLQNGDMKLAEDYLSKASKLDPGDAKKRTSLALTHLLGGKADAAFDELQAISDSDKDITADLALIAAHLRRGEHAKALAAIDRLEKKQPSDPLASDLRGRVELSRKNTAAARANFEKSLALDPTYYPAVADLAGLDWSEKKPEDARRRFEALLSKQPANTEAMLAMAKLASLSGAGTEEVARLVNKAITVNPAEIAPRLQLIDVYLNAKDYKKATAFAQESAATLPDSPDLVEALGRVQQASGEINQAIVTFNKLAEMQPYSPQPHIRLAEAYVAVKNREAAEQSLRKGLEIKPDMLEAQRALITLDFDSEKFEDAMRIARAVQKQRPTDAEGFTLEGDINAAKKDWDAAAAAYRSGLKQVSSSQLAVKLHTVLVSSGKTAEAEKLARSWLADHPKDITFLFYMGDIAIARNDYPTAEKYYLEVNKLQPDNPSALNNLAWLASQMKKDGAMAYATRALEISPAEPAFMDTMATLLSQQGKYAEAIEWLNKALALQPQNPLFRLNLAKTYIAAGDKSRAKTELQTLAKLGNAFAGQSEVSTLIRSL